MRMAKRGCWLMVGMISGLFCTGAHGPCATSCPTGAYLERDQSCWYDLDAGRWTKVNQGELEVRTLSSASTNKTPQTQPYRFVFVQDPYEQWVGGKQGRFGYWRIQLSTRILQPTSDLELRWRLREQPDALAARQTVRLVASWFAKGKRNFQVLDGAYHTQHQRVVGIIPAQLQQKPGLWLFPSKLTPPTAHTTALLHASYP